MGDKLKFVVHGKKEGDKFVLEGITNYILQNLDSFDDKTIIVTFELPVTKTIKLDSGKLYNWHDLTKYKKTFFTIVISFKS